METIFAALAAQFPPLEAAREDGLLCFGGDLRPERLLAAYSRGIFPWYEAGQPILWWSPNPRCVLPLEEFRLPARSARALRQKPFELTLDAAFGKVILACAQTRTPHGGTWLTPAMIEAYDRLHALGFAHSVEAWRDGELAGGLYGVGFGRVFFGESMFHVVSEASRAALAGLVGLLRLRGVTLLDCQQETPHIMKMGGVLLPREVFMQRLRQALASPADAEPGVGLPSTEHVICGDALHKVSDEQVWQPWRECYDYSLSSGAWASRS